MPRPTTFSPIKLERDYYRRDGRLCLKPDADDIVPTHTPYVATRDELETMCTFFEGIDFEKPPREERERTCSLQDELANLENLLESSSIDEMNDREDDQFILKGKRRRSGGSRTSMSFSFLSNSSTTLKKTNSLQISEQGRKDSLLSKISKLFSKSGGSSGSSGLGNKKVRTSKSHLRKRMKRFSRENKVVLQTGQWNSEEEAVLLHFAKLMTHCELKVIAKAAQEYGLKRAQRAMDKKLKRLLKFKSWKRRVPEEIISLAEDAINSSPAYQLDDEIKEKIISVVDNFSFGPSTVEDDC